METELILCACGCGATLERFDARGRARKFIHNHHAKLQPNMRVTVTCEQCGAPVLRPQWHMKRVNHHFCNHACEGVYSTNAGRRAGEMNGHYNTISVVCAGCGSAEVSKAVSLIHRRHNRVYCQDCLSVIRRGRPAHYYPPSFNKELREQIRTRDGRQCQNCGAADCVLHVHHIDYNNQNSDPRNLISLCRSCHGQTNFGPVAWQAKYSALIRSRFPE